MIVRIKRAGAVQAVKTVTLAVGLAGAVIGSSLAVAETSSNYGNYGFDVNDKVLNDSVYYSIGGGNVIAGPASRREPNSIGLGVGWNANLMCGNFDLGATVQNQLNGVTNGFKSLMSNVINAATGAVASLPAMIIQRSNPQLYDLLQNGVLQGKLSFDSAKLTCENMASDMTDMVMGSRLAQQAKADAYQQAAATTNDAVQAKEQAESTGGDKGIQWVGGARKGGKGQDPIEVIHDTAVAGANVLTNRTVTNTGTFSQATGSESCAGGSMCQVWSSPAELADDMVKVLGEKTLTTCTTCEQVAGKAGTGLIPMVAEAQDSIATTLAGLASGSLKVTNDNLAKVSGGELLQVSRSIIDSLRDDPERALLVQRLSGELALSRVLDKAILMRRALVAGASIPEVQNSDELQTAVDSGLSQLDREIGSLKQEMEIRKMLAENTALTSLSRKADRRDSNASAEDRPEPVSTPNLYRSSEE